MTAGHVFALELHSADPDRLAAFYGAELGIEFRTTDYPCRRHIAAVGRMALIVTDAQGHDAASDPGRVTLCMLAEGDPGGRTNYRLPPDRSVTRFRSRRRTGRRTRTATTSRPPGS